MTQRTQIEQHPYDQPANSNNTRIYEHKMKLSEEQVQRIGSLKLLKSQRNSSIFDENNNNNDKIKVVFSQEDNKFKVKSTSTLKLSNRIDQYDPEAS